MRRTKPKGCYVGKEDNFQKAVATYLDHKNVLWFHPVNEGKVPVQYRVKQKAKGLKPGVPDIMILESSDEYVGLAIELKIWPNKPTKEQVSWMCHLVLRNWRVATCYGIDEVREVVENYLKKEKII